MRLRALQATWHTFVSISLVTALLYCTLQYVLGLIIEPLLEKIFDVKKREPRSKYRDERSEWLA